MPYFRAVPGKFKADGIRARTLTYDRRYSLVCSFSGGRRDDDGLLLDCGRSHDPALISSEYFDVGFRVDDKAEGLFRYRCWLPVTGFFKDLEAMAVLGCLPWPQPALVVALSGNTAAAFAAAVARLSGLYAEGGVTNVGDVVLSGRAIERVAEMDVS